MPTSFSPCRSSHKATSRLQNLLDRYFDSILRPLKPRRVGGAYRAICGCYPWGAPPPLPPSYPARFTRGTELDNPGKGQNPAGGARKVRRRKARIVAVTRSPKQVDWNGHPFGRRNACWRQHGLHGGPSWCKERRDDLPCEQRLHRQAEVHGRGGEQSTMSGQLKLDQTNLAAGTICRNKLVHTPPLRSGMAACRGTFLCGAGVANAALVRSSRTSACR